MHSTASPGPDGFGPLFYKANWNTVSSDLFNFFDSFHSHSTDIERLNRSYLVLLPKKDAARKPQDFRPIALQNTTIKGISKVLTNRLQPAIPSLIANDQSGFVLGRCIADNFDYAADLLHCCYRRNSPTIVLKLDFHKAFDTVNSGAEASLKSGVGGFVISWSLARRQSFSMAFRAPGSIAATGLGKVTRSRRTCSSL
jgi:hypothetical protein